MLLPAQSLFAVHDVRDITGKKALATNYYYYWQVVVGGKQKTKHSSLSLTKLWGVLDVASVVTRYDTLRKMNSTVAPDAHWSFPSPPDALRLPGRAIIGLISCCMTSAWGSFIL